MRYLFRVVVLVMCFGFMYSTNARAATITITEMITLGPPFQVDFTVQEGTSGIVEILVVRSKNADTFVPPFMSGTTDPISLFSRKIDQTQPLATEFRVKSGLGEVVVHSFSDAVTVPEPSSLLLVAMAGGVLVRRRYRR